MLTLFDIEEVILTGEIIERQKDKITDEWKYKISGKSIGNDKVEIVVKISPTGMLVIITVYML